MRHRFCNQLPVPVITGSISVPTQSANCELAHAPNAAHAPNGTLPSNRSVDATFAQKLRLESAQRVDAHRTPITTDTAKAAIAKAYRQLTGEMPSESTSAILTAQWAHETGRGASMFNYNFGGIKGVGPSGTTVAQRTREGYGDTERRIVDNFRAYASVDEGAKDYVHLLLSRYGSAMEAARRGDPSGFVRGLKERGYFTGDPAAYERSIASLTHQILHDPGGPSTNSATGVDFASPRQGRAVSANATIANATEPHRHDVDSAAYWRAALSPTALLALSTGSRADSAPIGQEAQSLSALRALQMSDEVTRAALRVALEGEGEGADGTGVNRRR